MHLITYLLAIIFAFIIIPFPAAAACRSIMMYGAGNTPQWESDFGLKNVRVACSGTPSDCLRTRLDPNTGSLRYYEKLFLGMPITNDAATAAEYALQYSKLSKTYKKLYEVSFDDFYTFWEEKLQFDNTKLKLIIDNTKKVNKNLKFGITLYEDQLPLLSTITSANRGKVNYVHLYLHHRNTNIEADVQTVRNLFPNAKIIAGSYAFDFKSPCTITSTGACDGASELSFFKDSLKRQKALMDTCVIEAIEFWPAYFGNEDKISYDACFKKGKTQTQCVAETKEMRNAALRILNGNPTSTPTRTPTRRPTPTPTRRPTVTATRRPTPTPTRRPTGIPTSRPTSIPEPTTMDIDTPTPTHIYSATPTPENQAQSLPSKVKQNLDTSVKNIMTAVGNKIVSFSSVSVKPSAAPSATPKITPAVKKSITIETTPLSQTASIAAVVDEPVPSVQNPLETAKTYFISFMNFFIDTINSIF